MSTTAGLLCSFQEDTAGQQWTQDQNQQLPYKHSWLSHIHSELHSLFYSAAIGHYVHFKYKKTAKLNKLKSIMAPLSTVLKEQRQCYLLEYEIKLQSLPKAKGNW